MTYLKRWMRLCLVVLALGSAFPEGARSQGTEELTIAAAWPLKPALREILPLFESIHPSLNIRIVYGPSHGLRDQIQEGAPLDVFLAASIEDLNALYKKSMTINGRPIVYAMTSLVLVTSSSSHMTSASFSAGKITMPLRVAVGDPESTALGTATKDLLAKRPLASHVRYFYGSPDEVSKLVEAEEADVGIVFRPEAMTNPKLRIIKGATAQLGSPILFGSSIVWTCRRAAVPWAKQFIGFMQSEQAQHILQRYGYDQVPADLRTTER